MPKKNQKLEYLEKREAFDIKVIAEWPKSVG